MLLSCFWMVTIDLICQVLKFIDIEGYRCHLSNIVTCWKSVNRGHTTYRCTSSNQKLKPKKVLTPKTVPKTTSKKGKKKKIRLRSLTTRSTQTTLLLLLQ